MIKVAMTIRNPDSLCLNVIEAFLSFAEHGNAERAFEHSAAKVPTTIQRSIKRLELWLHRMLITDDNPARLTSAGAEFVEVAEKVRELAKDGGLWAERSKTRVSRFGVLSVEGVELRTEQAQLIGRELLGSQTSIISSNQRAEECAGEIYVYAAPRFKPRDVGNQKSRFQALKVLALNTSGNIKLMERSDLDQDGLNTLDLTKEYLNHLKDFTVVYSDTFGPFDLVSPGDIVLTD